MRETDTAVVEVAPDLFVLGLVEAVLGEEVLQRAVTVFFSGGARDERVEESLYGR